MSLNTDQGNCDNTCSKTLFGSMKVERLHGQRFATRRQAKDEAIDWLLWYNRARMHSMLAYVSPMQFERDQSTKAGQLMSSAMGFQREGQRLDPSRPCRRGGALAMRAAATCALMSMAACRMAAPEAPSDHWASFNGIYPGMSLAQAQEVGVENCVEKPGSRLMVCGLPRDKLQLGALQAQMAVLTFGSVGERKLLIMNVFFPGQDYKAVCSALAKRYGEPDDADSYYRWRRSDRPEYILSATRYSLTDTKSTWVRYVFNQHYDPKLTGGSRAWSWEQPSGCGGAP